MARTARPDARTSDQHAEADRISDALRRAADEHLRSLTNPFATTTEDAIFGENEFTCGDIAQRIAAQGIETALEGRKKGGTKGRADAATAAENPPDARVGRAKRA